MKIRLIKKQTLAGYWLKNASSQKALEEWLNMISYADWSKADDIKFTFRTSDLLGNGSHRVVFNIGGNKYRLICKYHFGESLVHLFVYWIGTHAEYDELNKKGLQYKINLY